MAELFLKILKFEKSYSLIGRKICDCVIADW